MRAFSIYRLALVVLCSCFVGCGTQANLPPSLANATPDKVFVVVDDVFENHAVTADDLVLTTDQVQQRVGKAQKWTDFSIEEVATGRYQGQATSPKGELLNVEVCQTADGVYSRWKNADGSGFGAAYITW